MSNMNSDVCVDITTDMFTLEDSYNVVFWNDDVTGQDYVVLVMLCVFELDMETAVMKMLDVHYSGSSNIGPYTYEEAEQRVQLVNELNRKTGNTLKVTIENI